MPSAVIYLYTKIVRYCTSYRSKYSFFQHCCAREELIRMLAELKTLANKKDVPYQSLIKIYLARQISLEHEYLPTALKLKRQKLDV